MPYRPNFNENKKQSEDLKSENEYTPTKKEFISIRALDRDYTNIQKIGSGSFGHVYKA